MSLPSGYVKLEYIQSSGTQHIDTLFKPNNNTRVVMDIEVLSSTANMSTMFGARTSATSNNYAFMWINNALRSDYNGAYTQTWDVPYTNRRVIDKNKETTTIDGVSKSYTNASFQSPVNLVLLALNNNGTVQWKTSAKLFSCEVYNNGSLIRKFIPCKNASGTVGLWDAVNAVFYGNAGTGTFTAGPAVATPDIPASFQQVMAIYLRWSAVDCTGYRIYRDDALIGETTNTHFVDLTADENTEYTYKLTAHNSGEESEPVALKVYTRYGYFVIKPLVQSAFFQ